MNDEPTQEELIAKRNADVEEAERAIAKEAKEEAERAKKEEEKRYCSYEQFETAIKNYDPDKDFRPDLLCGCACPNGSISIIAARPGGGKTSAMINIVRETLCSEKKNDRKILYINLEMNYRQILTNLHLSCIYTFATEEERAKLSQLKKTIFAFNSTMKGQDWADKHWLDDEDKAETQRKQVGIGKTQTFMSYFSKAKNLIKEAMDSGKLKIYDGIGQPNEEIQKEIVKYETGSLILLDYMQRLSAPKEFHNVQRYLQIQKASAELLKAAIERQLIVIAGAQLRREDKTNEASMESIRESGDIEQDAHNVVVLADGFAKVVKAREGGMGEKLAINPVKQFVFWETNGKYNSLQKDAGEMKKKTVKKKEKKRWLDELMPPREKQS
jgi:hypothetical protein